MGKPRMSHPKATWLIEQVAEDNKQPWQYALLQIQAQISIRNYLDEMEIHLMIRQQSHFLKNTWAWCVKDNITTDKFHFLVQDTRDFVTIDGNLWKGRTNRFDQIATTCAQWVADPLARQASSSAWGNFPTQWWAFVRRHFKSASVELKILLEAADVILFEITTTISGNLELPSYFNHLSDWLRKCWPRGRERERERNWKLNT